MSRVVWGGASGPRERIAGFYAPGDGWMAIAERGSGRRSVHSMGYRPALLQTNWRCFYPCSVLIESVRRDSAAQSAYGFSRALSWSVVALRSSSTTRDRSPIGPIGAAIRGRGKAALSQWVRDPPGYHSSREQPVNGVKWCCTIQSASNSGLGGRGVDYIFENWFSGNARRLSD